MEAKSFPVRYIVLPMQFLGCGGKFFKILDTAGYDLHTVSRFMRLHWAHLIAALLNQNEGYIYHKVEQC